ncbi:MAG: permease-like cell division protein FtsX [Bacteroidaceae bacterium]|nr:permease-like cell division protein FtsX [Bacteroidaceae bacterium]
MKKATFKIQTISVYISTTLVLLLLGVMGITIVGAKSLSESVKQNLTVSVIIKKNIQEKAILRMQKEVEKFPAVKHSRYISRDQALAEEKEALGTDPTELLGYNPFEASLELTLNPEYSNSDSIARLEEGLMKRDEVKEVAFQKELLDTINNNIHRAGIMMMALFVMLTLISWSLINNLVRLSIYSRRFLLHTMKLVGATWGFIRRPFMMNNLRIGLFAGILADILLASGLYMIYSKEPAIMTLMPTEGLVLIGLLVILFGMGICALCAYLSVNRFLRMRSNDLYFI